MKRLALLILTCSAILFFSFFDSIRAQAPACVINTSPANGSTLASAVSSTLLTWTAAATATSYDVFIWGGPYPALTPIANVTSTSYTAINLTASTVYTWYIVPKNASGSATACAVSNKTTFTTLAASSVGTGLQGVYYNNTTLTGLPLLTRTDTVINFLFPYLTSPVPGIVPDEHYSVQWTGQVKAQYAETYTFYTLSDDGIRLWVNGMKLIDNWVNQGATEKSGTITLAAGQKYNIRIDYYENTGDAVTKLSWSSPSTPKAVVPASQLYPTGYTQQPETPQCVNNTSPSDQESLPTTTTATLNWPVSATATSYDVYLYIGGVPPASPIANVTTNSYNATGLLPGSYNSWYVVPRNDAGAATGCISNTTHFRTAFAETPAPSCTHNNSPADGAILSTQTTAFLQWAGVPDADIYDVYLWTGNTAPQFPTAQSLTAYPANNLLPGTVYKWFVAPRNRGGAATGCISNKTTFTTAPVSIPLPACAINSAPANNSTIGTQTTATLTWGAVTYASSYDVYLWTGPIAPATPTTNTTGTSFNTSGLLAATSYNWYVVPRNATGPAVNCGIANKSTFTTAAATTGNGTGLLGDYYNGITLSGTPLLSRIDPVIDFALTYSTVLSPAPGIVPEDGYSVRWTGQVKALYSETYTFYTLSDDGIRLWVNGVKLVDNWVNQGATEKSGTITLTAGLRYDIVIEYYENTGEAITKLSWSSASTPKAVVPQSQLYPPVSRARFADTGTVKAGRITAYVNENSSFARITSAVSPNPVKPGQLARVQINSNKTSTITMSVINSSGIIINTKKINLLPGINTTTVNTFSLAKGLYIIGITGGSQPFQLKLLIE